MSENKGKPLYGAIHTDARCTVHLQTLDPMWFQFVYSISTSRLRSMRVFKVNLCGFAINMQC